MKKLCITILLVGALLNTKAQTLSNKLFAGGSVSFEFAKASVNDNSKTYNNPKGIQNYSISPYIGYHLSNRIAIGLQLGYSSTENALLGYYRHNNIIDSIQRSYITNKTYSVAPYIRYYFPITEKFCVYLNTSIPISYAENTNTVISTLYSSAANGYVAIQPTNTIKSIGINISPVFQWFFRDNIAITGSVGALYYTHSKIETTKNIYPALTDNVDDLKMTLSTGLSFGVVFYFGKGKKAE